MKEFYGQAWLDQDAKRKRTSYIRSFFLKYIDISQKLLRLGIGGFFAFVPVKRFLYASCMLY